MKKDIKLLIRSLRKQGWIVKDKSRHYMCLCPDGRHQVVVAKTPSDYRSYANCVSLLRRHGADL